MCGINGMIFEPKTRTQEQLDKIRKIFGEMFVLTDARGGHASGLIEFSNDKSPRLFKLDCEALYLTNLDGYKNIINGITNETTFVMAHTRFATQGSSKNPLNCHPIITLPIVGVHNGIIHNDTSLFKQFNIERIGEVDSEIIFQLISIFDSPYELSSATAEKVFSLIKGMATVAYATIHNPNQICLVRGNNPLSIGYDKDLGVLWFNSLESIILKAYLNYQRWSDTKIMDNLQTYILPESKGLVINTNNFDFQNLIGVEEFKVPKLSVASSQSWFNRNTATVATRTPIL